ncbi:MAG: metalloregulator ArsR/SmtB family transcription factor [Actinomycetia bacterium]|nr:metalloregulator ArsR/SmtB family transcription factor [Actinomycetes bacterium]
MEDESFYCLHSEVCKTLANAKRQMILESLRDGEVSVSDIAARTGIPQATLSQHLSILRSRGVVHSRRAGANVLYTIANPKILTAFDLITEVMRESLVEQSRSAALGSDNDEAGTARRAV